MTNTASETPAQVTSKPRISNRVQYRLDQVEKAMRAIESAVETFDDELDELTGLTSEDVDELAGDLRSEAQHMLGALGARLRSLHREIEAAAEGGAS
jgi:uncharacterized phage infection (PIP) family protein YhgE